MKILAPLTGGTRDATVLAAAFAAAKPFNAHVVALFVRPDPAEAMPFFGEGVSGAMAQEIVDAAKKLPIRRQKAHARRWRLPRTMRRCDHRHADETRWLECFLSRSAGQFRRSRGAGEPTFRSRCVRPPKVRRQAGAWRGVRSGASGDGPPGYPHRAGPPKNFAQRIAVGWDGSSACAKALLAAMPYLARAQHIDLLTIRKPNTACESCDEAAEYLRMHALNCTERQIEAGNRPVGQALLEAASGSGADLLVLGGYGHGRLLQMFAGGVTKHVVAYATLPLFLVH